MGGIIMTIEERAILNLQYEKDFLGRNLSDDMVCRAYIRGAKEQKAIDIDNACIILCRYACPHKIDSNKCWNTECDTRETFRRMMER